MQDGQLSAAVLVAVLYSDDKDVEYARYIANMYTDAQAQVMRIEGPDWLGRGHAWSLGHHRVLVYILEQEPVDPAASIGAFMQVERHYRQLRPFGLRAGTRRGLLPHETGAVQLILDASLFTDPHTREILLQRGTGVHARNAARLPADLIAVAQGGTPLPAEEKRIRREIPIAAAARGRLRQNNIRNLDQARSALKN